MTFEEFLIRKKIDAVQLKEKEQAFFTEFESHFRQMGEKSFDHSKKFWFNKLRRAYHLKEEPKPAKEETKIEQIPAYAQEKPATETINQGKPAYVPRFKAAAAQKEDQPAQKTASKPPPAYIPRFKAAIKIPEIPEKVEETDLNKEPESEEKVKPAYKPRFKAQIPAPEEKNPEITAESIPQSIEQSKPTYKPRFKPGLTKKGSDSE